MQPIAAALLAAALVGSSRAAEAQPPANSASETGKPTKETVINVQTAEVFSVRDFGATGDGQAFDGPAIQKAIDACGKAGGGQVLLPAGEYVSGTLVLRGNVTLVISRGATLRGSKDLSTYNSPDGQARRWLGSLIRAQDVSNVHIKGEGTIDGNSVRNPEGEEKIRGPHTILFNGVRDSSVSGITIRDSSNYAIIVRDAVGFTVDGVKVFGGWDGVNIHKSKSILVKNCKFQTGDDAIAAAHIEDAVFRDCVLNSACNPVRILGACRRVAITDCEIYGPGKYPHVTTDEYDTLAAIIYQPGAWNQPPGYSDDVTFARLKVRDVQTVLHVGMRPGNGMGSLLVEDITATGVYGPATSIEGCDDSPIGKATLRRFRVDHALPVPDCGKVRVTKRMQYQQTTPEVRDLMFCVRPLPVWALYAKNVRQLVLEDVSFNRVAPSDVRAIRYDKVDNVAQSRVVVKPAD